MGVYLIIVISILLFFLFTYIKEKEINNYYITHNHNDAETYKAEAVEQNDIYDYLIKKRDSFKSSSQTFFLEAEQDNQILNQELKDEFKNLDYNKYNKEKIQINEYLLDNNLPLKSIQYNTDGAIFLMNVLEFLNTPIFFFFFCLITPIIFFKKYEDKRINMLLVLPIPRYKILLQDYKLFIRNLVKIVSTVLIISTIVSFGISHQFSWNYPIIITLFNKTRIIPIYIYIVILLFTLFFVNTFFFFLSYFFILLLRKVTLSLIVTITLCILMSIVISHSVNELNGLNPFAYTDVEKLTKNKVADYRIKYVVQTDRHIGVDKDLYTGNIVENPYYFANDSLANQFQTIDISILPIILLIYSTCLFLIDVYLIDHFKT